MICYIDADAFAVSVERLLHGELCGRTVIVSTQTAERGLVACGSYEARRAGVWAGMPVGLVRRRVEHAVILPPNPIECERASRRLFTFLHQQAPIAQAHKIDGVYLDMTGCQRWMARPVINWAEQLARHTLSHTGLPVSIGIAPNKLIARIAARIAKPAGIIHVPPGHQASFLDPVSVSLLPGIGRAAQRELHEFGIHRAGQLRALGHETLQRLYGHTASSALWRHLHGQCDEPVTATPIAQTLDLDHTFSDNTSRPLDIDHAAALLAQRLAWQLRSQHAHCATTRITLIYSDGHHATRTLRLQAPTTQDSDLTNAIRRAAAHAFQRRVRVRSLHLSATLHPEPQQQFDFFQQQKQQRTARLHAAIDEVRARHGFAALVLAGATTPARHIKHARQSTMEELW